MINGLGKFFERHLGQSQDFRREPTLVDDMAEDCPAFAVGAGLGAAVGALGGYAKGMHDLTQDVVTRVTDRTEFTHPVLVGAHYVPESCTTNYTYDDKGNISGFYNTCDSPYFSPRIQQNSTGLIEVKERFVHSHSWGPLSSAGVGALAGCLAGALTGALVQKVADPTAKGQSQNGWRTPLMGVALGAAVGAGAGWISGAVAQGRSQTLDQVIRTPVTQNQVIGFIPHAGDVSQVGREVAISDPNQFLGRNQVVRPVPTGDYHTHREVTHSETLTPWGGAALGLGLGMVVGGVTGVAVDVLNRMIR